MSKLQEEYNQLILAIQDAINHRHELCIRYDRNLSRERIEKKEEELAQFIKDNPQFEI